MLRGWRTVAPFLLPFTAVFAVFLVYPAFYSVWLSFRKATIYTDLFNIFGAMEYVGLDNYRRLLTDKQFYWSLCMTGAYGAIIIPLTIGIALGLATLLNNRLPGARFFRSAFFLPTVLDLFVVSIVWTAIYAPNFGVLAQALALFGISDKEVFPTGLLGDAWWALPAVAVAVALKGSGFGMVLYLAAIQNIPADVYEAAEIDGATAWQRLTKITIPLVKPITLLLVVTGILGSLQAFAEFYAMTGGTPYVTLPDDIPFLGGTTQGVTRVSGYYLFDNFYTARAYGYAAAISVGLLFVALPVSAVSFVLFQPDAEAIRTRLGRLFRRGGAVA